MDRFKDLLQCSELVFENAFSESIAFLQNEYEKDIYWQPVKKILEDIAEAAYSDKEKFHLGILYLDSSVVTKSYEFLIALMSDKFYLEPYLTEYYWRPQLFFEEFEKNMESVILIMEKSYRHVQPFEVQMIKKYYVKYYYAAIYKLLVDMNKILNMGDNVSLFYGRYRGKAQIIRE